MRTELGLHVRYLPPADATLPAEQPVDRLVQIGTIDEQPHRITPVQPEAPAMPVGQRPPRRVLQQPQATDRGAARSADVGRRLERAKTGRAAWRERGCQEVYI